MVRARHEPRYAVAPSLYHHRPFLQHFSPEGVEACFIAQINLSDLLKEIFLVFSTA